LITVTVDDETKLITATCSGTLSLEDLNNYLSTNWTDSRLEYDELFELGDAMAALDYGALLIHCTDASQYNSRHLVGRSRSAIVAKDRVQTELADFYRASMTLHDVRDVEVFGNSTDAINWLRSDDRDFNC
jgi:hypothetical protein